MTRGLFISFEGIDGAGKSTHIDRVAQMFREAGRAVVLSREPGGTPLSEKLRELVLHADQLTLGTLDSFFARLVNQFALELGLETSKPATVDRILNGLMFLLEKADLPPVIAIFFIKIIYISKCHF